MSPPTFFAVCRNICYCIFDGFFSGSFILELRFKNLSDFELSWTQFTYFFAELDVIFLAIVFFFIYGQFVLVKFNQKFCNDAATRIIFAILVLGALASLTRWFLKHTETVKAKEIAQITKTYEEKVQKTKREMFVDSSYNLKSHEETFLSSVLACIEKNIGNQDFTVEALASHACMTRGNLHLKLKNLTGKTPVELIKTMRMKRACELMKETDLSIADIAEQTGFQTPGYFITVFKNHFGETPGHYASRVRQQ